MSQWSARSKYYQANRLVVLERDNYQCQSIGCNKEATQADHVYPRSLAIQQGWTEEEADGTGNLVAMCSDCNKAKGNKQSTRIEFEAIEWFSG